MGIDRKKVLSIINQDILEKQAILDEEKKAKEQTDKTALKNTDAIDLIQVEEENKDK